jgi:hypothetical protein
VFVAPYAEFVAMGALEEPVPSRDSASLIGLRCDIFAYFLFLVWYDQVDYLLR